MRAWQILKESVQRWWYDWFSLLLLGYGWALAQILVIPGPPATAVLFEFCRRSMQGEYWELREVWRVFKRRFWPAWRWGAIFGLGLLVVSVNLLAFAGESAWYWQGLRLFWLLSLLVWVGLNGLYWPFWLAQAARSWRQTQQNGLRFWLRHPFVSLLLALITTVLLPLSFMTLLPILLGVAPLFAMLWTVAVERSLAEQGGAARAKI